MSGALTWEARLIAAADGLTLAPADLSEVRQSMQHWLSDLTAALSARQLPQAPALRETQALARQVRQVNALLAASAPSWERDWQALEPAQQLAQTFEDKVMLLVFGKFNAGKSSLCNFLADRFAGHGQPVRYFHLACGRIIDTAHPLREGATETTARLQGVCLGQHLVLLDTPGLHSVTPENAALTQRFTDSADAVLWLTSSTSPGQVQELDELARELHRHKPLLPVITRSDLLEEDEVEGEIVKILRNKSASNRALQEADVLARARDKLRVMGVQEEVLRLPVSVSVHALREQGQTPLAMAEGGFENFCAALMGIVEPARLYKQRKPAEVMLHHLEESVLATIESSLVPAVSELLRLLAQERQGLHEARTHLVRCLWREVAPALPAWLERHAPVRDWTGLGAVVAAELHQALPGSFLQLREFELRLPSLDELERAVLQALGGDVSPFAADDSFDQQHDALQRSVHRLVLRCVDEGVEPCARVLDSLTVRVESLRDCLLAQRGSLMRIQQRVRENPSWTSAISALTSPSAGHAERSHRVDHDLLTRDEPRGA